MKSSDSASAVPSVRRIPEQFERFDLVIDEISGLYRARVDASPTGACAPVEIDLSGVTSDGEVGPEASRGIEREIRRQSTTEHDDFRRLGERLFRAVFVDELSDRFRAGLERARAKGKGMRLRLRFESAAGLAGLPWEVLWDPRTQRHLADEPDVPIVRDLASWEGHRGGPAPEATLKIAALLPQPTGEPRLSGDTEWAEIERRLAPLDAIGVIARRIEPPTRKQLADHMDTEPCQVLHVVAHGEPGAPKDGGVLVLQSETGAANRVSGTRLTQALSGRLPRLVVLNACHSARSHPSDAFDGLAQHLLTQGVAAVIAMRTAIDDAAAVTFALALYSELARGRTIEEAMIVGRRRLVVEHPDAWSTPVLYLRAEHLRLFDPSRIEQPKLGRWSRFWGVGGPLAALVAMAFAWLSWSGIESSEPMAETMSPQPFGKLRESDPRCPEVPGVDDLHFVWIEADTLELSDRSLTVEKAFCISTTEVSRRDWRTVTGDEPARPDWPMTWPITDVAINSTAPFFAGLDARKKGWTFRLPTPPEWELAGRAGAKTEYFFGDDAGMLDRYGNSKNYLGIDGRDGPAPVASYPPNAYGLHDVHGNVAEWVHDPGEEPRFERDVLQAERRGGSWEHGPLNCRFSAKTGRWVRADKEDRIDTGFRVVAVAVDASTKKAPGEPGASGDR